MNEKPIVNKFLRQAKEFEALEKALAIHKHYILAEVAKELSKICVSLAEEADKGHDL